MFLNDNNVVLLVLVVIRGYLTACPINCETCHNNTLCAQCKSGYYGQRCKKECDKCIDKQCDLLSCNNGCEVGKYRTLKNGTAVCTECHTYCKYCKDYYHCRVCEDAYFLYQFKNDQTICAKCPKYVTDCQNYCKIQYCKVCIVQNSSNVCTKCIQGYKLKANKCFHKTEVCSEGCLTECDSVGICNGNCKDGLTGDHCADPCSANCLKCQKKENNFCQKCKEGFYTRTCNVECPSACKRVAGLQTCKIDDGSCLHECGDNFWGRFCNESCSIGCGVGEDNSTSCTKTGGKCTNGCKDGFVGNKCIVVETSVKQNREGSVQEDVGILSTDPKPDATMLPTRTTSTQLKTSEKCQCEEKHVQAYISGLGSSVVIAALIVSIYFIRRRYVLQKVNKDKKSTETSEMTSYYNVSANETQHIQMTGIDEPSYESLRVDRNAHKVYSELETQPERVPIMM